MVEEAIKTSHWFVYIILGTDGNYYTGITTDVKRRWKEHCGYSGSKLGAKYFRGRKPKALAYLEDGHTRSTASQREYQIKKMTKNDKIKLLNSKENLFKQVEKNLI